mgnify:CR=1 FL=1
MDLATLEAEFAELVFPAFTEETALHLGLTLVEMARALGSDLAQSSLLLPPPHAVSESTKTRTLVKTSCFIEYLYS